MPLISNPIFLPLTKNVMYISQIFVYLNICDESCGRVEKSCILLINIQLFELYMYLGLFYHFINTYNHIYICTHDFSINTPVALRDHSMLVLGKTSLHYGSCRGSGHTACDAAHQAS